MKNSRRQSLKQKLTVALSLVNALNMAAPVALPYVNVAKNVRADGGQAERLSDFLARSLYGTAQATTYNVPPNSTVDTMNGGDWMVVEDGGTGTVTTMKNGNQTVSSGGTGTIATMNNGNQIVSNGGTGTVVTMGGGTQIVSNGGVGTVTTMGGGTQKAYGGTGTVETMIGGQQNVNSSGTGTVVTMRGGEQLADNGCMGTVTTMSGGTQCIRRGGTGTVETMSGGTQLLDYVGGTGIVVTMSGGEQIVSSFEYEDTVYIGTGTISTMSGGTQTVSSGSLGTVTTMSGGEQIVSNGGTGTVAAMNGGEQQVINGGTGTVLALNSGGTQIVSSGGTAKDTKDAGGVLELHGGAVLKSGNAEIGYEDYALSGGTMRLTEGAEVSGYTVSSGTLELASGGTAKDTTINGGTQNVEKGGVASGGTLKNGAQNIASGGTATGMTVSGGTQNIASGGTAKDTTVNGGTQNIEKGGVASGGTLKNGAQNIASGGTTTGMTVSGGTQNIEPGATVIDTTVKGGTQTIENGALAVGGVLSDGALQIVEAGGTAQDLTLNDGGAQNVYGTATGATVNSGGTQHIFSGGSATGTMLSGGTITVEDYATAQIDTAAGGMVELLDAGLATAIFGNGASAGSYAVDTLYARGDTVILGQGDASPSPVGKKLVITNMDGYANFVVNTDLANNKSDQIEIGTVKNASKANTIKINYDPTLAAGQTVANTKTLVATVQHGKTTFKGAESNIGGLKYLPNLTTEDGGKSWYIATMEKKGANESTHHALMGMTAGMSALAAGTAFIDDASRGLGLMANTGKDGVSAFAKFGGNSIRQETGSHVDVKTWNAILALGHANKKERGTFEYGAFFEYGSSNYTTHDADLRGDGSMDYTGGGVLAKWTVAHGFYVEGSLRAGTVHDDASNVLRDDVNTYSYDTNANYFSAHIGVGREIEVANNNTVDVYGKFFFNRRNGVSFETVGNNYDLDAVKSEILRVGARYTMKREKWNFYGGLAYEHEFGGKAEGTVDGLAIRSADTKGGSARLELGATMKPDVNSPWSLDLNVAGFAGKKQGVSGGVSVSFTF